MSENETEREVIKLQEEPSPTTYDEVLKKVEEAASALKPGPDTKPTPGRIAYYVAQECRHTGLEGGVVYPAMIVRVWSPTCVNLSVFSDSDRFPLHIIRSVSYDESGAPGTWHWPVRK